MAVVVNITDYVGNLDAATRDKLYDSPWTCQAVLRSLPVLAKHYILRVVWLDGGVPQEGVANWVSRSDKFSSQHDGALQRLMSLGLFQLESREGGTPVFILHPAFKTHLQWALAGGAHVVSELPAQVLEQAPTMEQLDSYAHSQWEALQLFLLNYNNGAPAMPGGVPCDPLEIDNILLHAGLVVAQKRDRSITDIGFQFLLKDNYRQLWGFLTKYIEVAEQKSGAELSSVISFIMQLGFRQVGQPCPFDSLTVMERAIAGHMMQLGVLYPFWCGKLLFFCPTRLASSLCGGFNPGAISANADIAGGHIIVETNYRVYAYTQSRVQTSILELFCRTDCVLPNLYVGTLTRETVHRALETGISSEDVVDYLQHHPHPQVANKVPVVPEVVSDQVRLWEAETMRLRADGCTLYDAFETPELFARSLEFARNNRLVLWEDREKKVFAARESGHDSIKGFIGSLKRQLGL